MTDTPLEQLTIRASSGGAADLCPGSIRGELEIDPVNSASTTGTCAHDIMAQIIRQGLDELPGNYDEICQSYTAVDPDDLRPVVNVMIRAWQQRREYYPDPNIEQQLKCELAPGLRVIGHPDVDSVCPPSKGDDKHVIRTWDTKTGYLDRDHTVQIYLYWLLRWAQSGLPADTVRFEADIVKPRLLLVDQMSDSAEGVLAWMRRFVQNVGDWDGVFHPGVHCHHCRRGFDCQARDQWMASLVRDLTDESDNAKLKLCMRQITDKDPAVRIRAGQYLAEIMGVAKSAAERGEAIRGTLREYAKTAPIQISDDWELRIVESTRARINLRDAAPVIGAGMPEFLGQAWLSRTALNKAAKAAGLDSKALSTDLEEAGVVRMSRSSSLRQCKINKTKETKQ